MIFDVIFVFIRILFNHVNQKKIGDFQNSTLNTILCIPLKKLIYAVVLAFRLYFGTYIYIVLL